MTKHDERADLKLVAEYLAQRRVTCIPYSKAEKRARSRAGKQAPDFRLVHVDCGYFGNCEVKSPLELDRGEVKSCQRIARHILKAVDQLADANLDGSALNVVAFVSHDLKGSATEFWRTIGGVIPTSDGDKGIPAYSITASKLNPARASIDVFLWFGASASGELTVAALNRTLGEDRFNIATRTLLGLEVPFPAPK